MDRDLFITGGILFVIGLVAGNLQATVFMMGLGLVFMAGGLGKDICEDLYDFFKSIFEDLI